MSHEQNDQQAQMLRGTAWMTASNFISRLLGAAYIIPWYIWMGKYGPQANGLFTMGYNIYAWFLLISTAGVPVAVAKQVAKYNTRDQADHSFALGLLEIYGNSRPWICHSHVSFVSCFCESFRWGKRVDSDHAEPFLGCLDLSFDECHSGIFPRF